MELTTLALLALVALLALALGFFLARSKSTKSARDLEIQVSTLTTQLEHAQQQHALERDNLENAHALAESLRSDIDALRNDLSEQRERAKSYEVKAEQVEQGIASLRIENSRLEEKLETQREAQREAESQLDKVNSTFEEREASHQRELDSFNEQKEALKLQFKELSNEILKNSTQTLQDVNKQSLSATINPFKESIEAFKKQVNDNHQHETVQRTELRKELESLKELNAKITTEAHELSTALRGQKKLQGNWGELVLERLLEESGLQRGREYETQLSLQTEEGDRRYPDVLIRLPQEKDIVIDSKVSLLDYEAYCSSDDEQEKALFLKKHVQSIRNHVSGLSLKEYEKLEGIRSLDFVFLFVPVEAAFMAALQADNRLFQDAYNKHIVLVSPTTLLASLRTVENLWRHEKQHKNAQKIADQAGALHDQFMMMLQSLDDLGKQLDKTHGAYETTRKRLFSGRGNLVKRTLDIQKLGAKTKKALPDSYMDELESSEAEQDETVVRIEAAPGGNSEEASSEVDSSTDISSADIGSNSEKGR